MTDSHSFSHSFSSRAPRMQSVRRMPHHAPAGNAVRSARDSMAETIEAVQAAFRTKPGVRHREPAYIAWIKKYLEFYGTKPMEQLDEVHVEAFLSNMASQDHITLTHQVEALDALRFLHEDVRGEVIEGISFVRAPAFHMPTERWYRAPQSVDTSFWDYT